MAESTPVALQRLRYLLNQAKSDRALRAAYGLTRARVAAAIGTSPRSLGRYLSGERRIPDDLALRASVLAEDLSIEVAEDFRTAAVDEEIPYATVDGLPLRIERYKRPRTIGKEQARSEIIVVDVDGLSNNQVAKLLRRWWEVLKRKGGKWDVRFLVQIEVAKYFEGGVQSNAVRKTIKRRKFMPMWIPPYSLLFADSEKRRIAGRFKKADDALEFINEQMTGAYIDRIPEDYGFLKVAFVPYFDMVKPKRPRRRRYWKQA